MTLEMADRGHHAEDGCRKRQTSGPSCQHVLCYQLFAVFMFIIGLVGGIFIGMYVDPKIDNKENKNCPSSTNQVINNGNTEHVPTVWNKSSIGAKSGECPFTSPVTQTRYEDTMFAPLTNAEMYQAARFLKNSGIISTLEEPTDLTQNFILYQWLDVPAKNDALNYLDGNGEKPKRYARVTVQRGADLDVMEYKVGPLGSTSTPMTSQAMTRSGEIHFNSRPYEAVEVDIMTEMLKPDLAKLADLMAESFDGIKYPDDVSLNFYNGPPSMSGTTRDTRWSIMLNGFGYDQGDVDLIHILPLSGRIHHPGTNTSEWYAYDFHYLNQGPYKTARDLMDAYKAGAIRKVRLDKGFRASIVDRIFPKRDTSKPLREQANKQGPRTYYPTGPRYKIDGTNVKWMDWSFEISGGQIRGPALFDVKFKGERILYELAVNDIALNYATDSHSQNNIIYADATYGIMGGDTPGTVIKDIDCPVHGSVLQTSFWWPTTQRAYNMSSICVYEADGQSALWRHAGMGFEAGLRNRYLVVSVPVVIGNYDYTFEFHFFLDGKIFNYARASGYIQASFWDRDDPKWPDKTRDSFGYRVSDYMSGPIHDHMFGFKVDFDLIDKNNSFQLVNWKAGPILEAIRTQNASIPDAPEYFIYNETRYIDWEPVQTERAITKQAHQQFMVVVNTREKNKWGVERGYVIEPLATGSQSLNQHPILNALSFTKHHCAVTKRKEDEKTLTSMYDVNRMNNPQGYLEKFIDNESIVDDDIVNWVTVGFLHIPTSEDMPMTVRVETGFLLRPFNFFDRTASFDMPQHTDTIDGVLKESEPNFEQCAEPPPKYCRFC